MKQKKPNFEPLAIVGMSCLFPKAQSLEDYWGMVKEKIDAISEVPKTHWRSEDFFSADKKAPDHVYTKNGGFLDPVDFNPGEWGIAPSDLDSIDTSQLLSLVVAQGAMTDAGYHKNREFNRDNVSVILGLTGTLELVIPLGARLGHPIWKKAMLHAGIPEKIADEVVDTIGKSYVSWQENSFPGLLGNVTAGRIANRFDLGGTNCVVDAACGSALSALNLAAMELWIGKCDMAITGGVDTFNDIFMYMCFCKTPALSPTGQARPFSEDNDGTIIGEGIGMYVLKRLTDAERDGDRIYATINAVGTSSDGKGKAIYAPGIPGQIRVLRRAYEQAGISPRDVTMIEAHGTGTGAGDEVEISALNEIYGVSDTNRPWCAIGSVKSQIGHTKAAAGSAGVIKAAMALYHKVIPPTIKVSRPAKALRNEKSPFYLPNNLRPWIHEGTRYAAVSSLGFGGSNYHVVLSEYKSDKNLYDWPRGIELATISGKTTQELISNLDQASATKNAVERRTWAAQTRKTFSVNDPHRLCFPFNNQAEELNKMVSEIKQAFNSSPKNFNLPNGASYESENLAAPVGVIFPGQGSQYVGMGLDLNCFAPETFTELATIDKALGAIDADGNHLVDYIYPVPQYDAEKDALSEEKLRSTDVAQPSIGAVSIGTWRLLEKLGLKAEAFAGHSYGELVSLCAAGVYDSAALAQISRKRGELMAQRKGDRGGMLAIAADRKTVEEIIQSEKLDLIVANHNSPQQVVLSGPTSEIEKAQKAFKNKKLRGTVLKVAGAFHSSLVADAAEPFHDFLRKIKFNKPAARVYANSTAETYPAKDADLRKLLGNQLANPVRFVEMIEKMYADGIRTFIEVGPGGKMVNLIKAILEGKEHRVIATDSSAGKRHGVADLARVIGQLCAIGYQLETSFWQNGVKWLEAHSQEEKPRLTFPVCGANYRSAKQNQVIENLHKAPGPAKQIAIQAPAASVDQPTTAVQTQHARPQPAPAPVSNNILKPAAASAPAPVHAAPAVQVTGNSETLRMTREALNAMQMLQQQTADLHRRFLEGQEQAQNTILALINNSVTGARPASFQPAQPVAYVQPVAQQIAPPSPAAVQPQISAPATKPAPVAARPAAAQAPVEKAPVKPSANISPVLLEVVSEKTGYPIDMLNLDMDMEADLGIDSIKRVEIMSAMQEKLPNAPVVQPDQLGKLRTLAQILEHLGHGSHAAAQARPAENIVPVLLEVVSEKTGYPSDMLNLDMDMEADLGIDSIKRVEIMSAMQERLPDAPVIQPDQLGKLRTLAQIIEHLGQGSMTAAPQAEAAQAPAGNMGNIVPILLEVVGEKTGYPGDMLNPEMDMEADLGIDSIKRVEIMSAMQERLPDAPVIQPDQLGKLRTLAQIIEHLGQGSMTAAPQAEAAQAPAGNMGNIVPILLEVVGEKTGYPGDMLNPEMDMEADLGIDSIKRVEILSAFQERVPDAPVVQPGDLGKFRTIGQIIEYLSAGSKKAPQPAMASVAAMPVAKAEPEYFPIKRTVLKVKEIDNTPNGKTVLSKGDLVVVADDGSDFSDSVCQRFEARGLKTQKLSLKDIATGRFDQNLKGLVIMAPQPERGSQTFWSMESEEYLKDVFMATRKAGMVIHARKSGLIATVTRMDGAFALANLTRTVDPVQGGLAGLTKTISHEWPEVTARAIDLDYRFKDTAAAEKLVGELMVAGPLETGLTRSGRVTLVEETINLAENPGTPACFARNEVIVVTGGARGVTAATAIAMAEKYHCRFALIGRSAAPENEPAWLSPLRADAEIKNAILKNTGKKLTPKELEADFKSRMANREILENIAKLSAAADAVKYYSADIRDQKEIEMVFGKIRSDLGPIACLVHGAGVLRDRRIEDKTRDQLDDVINTKITGLRAALNATQKDNLKAIVLFSSFSGRSGRTGQVDYAMANEALNKIAHKMRILRPDCRTMSFNWGPWDGGMVTPGLRNIFLAEGIGLIPLKSGARQPVIELSHQDESAVEIGIMGLIAGKDKPEQGNTENSGGNDTEKKLVKVFDYELKLDSNAWMKDHVMNGDAVLPMAVTAEMLIHTAIMQNPGLDFIGYDEMRVLKGVVMQNRHKKIEFFCSKPVKSGNHFVVTSEIRSDHNGRQIVNARANILLGETSSIKAPAPLSVDNHLVYPHSINEAYQNHLFHGEFLTSLETVEGWSDQGISGVAKASLPPENWSSDTLCNRWYSDPLAVDAAYQLMILWTCQSCGAPSLPTYAAHYRQFCQQFPEKVAIRATARRNAQIAVADIDFLDTKGKVLARIEGYECVINEALREAFKLRTIGGAQK